MAMVDGRVKGYRQPLDILHLAEGHPIRYWFPPSCDGHGLLELGVGVCWVEPENCFFVLQRSFPSWSVCRTIR